MPLTSPIVEFGQSMAGHRTTPKPALPLKVWAYLVKLGKDGNMAIRIAAGLVLRVAVSGLEAPMLRGLPWPEMSTPSSPRANQGIGQLAE